MGTALNIVRRKNMRSAPHHATLQEGGIEGTGQRRGPYAMLHSGICQLNPSPSAILAPQRDNGVGRRRWLKFDKSPPAAYDGYLTCRWRVVVVQFDAVQPPLPRLVSYCLSQYAADASLTTVNARLPPHAPWFAQAFCLPSPTAPQSDAHTLSARAPGQSGWYADSRQKSCPRLIRREVFIVRAVCNPSSSHLVALIFIFTTVNLLLPAGHPDAIPTHNPDDTGGLTAC